VSAPTCWTVRHQYDVHYLLPLSANDQIISSQSQKTVPKYMWLTILPSVHPSIYCVSWNEHEREETTHWRDDSVRSTMVRRTLHLFIFCLYIYIYIYIFFSSNTYIIYIFYPPCFGEQSCVCVLDAWALITTGRVLLNTSSCPAANILAGNRQLLQTYSILATVINKAVLVSQNVDQLPIS